MNISDLPKDPKELLMYLAGLLLQIAVILAQEWLKNRRARKELAAAQAASGIPKGPTGGTISRHGPTAILLLLATGSIVSLTMGAQKGQIGQLLRGGCAPTQIAIPADGCVDCSRPGCKCTDGVCRCTTRDKNSDPDRPHSLIGLASWNIEPIDAISGYSYPR